MKSRTVYKFKKLEDITLFLDLFDGSFVALTYFSSLTKAKKARLVQVPLQPVMLLRTHSSAQGLQQTTYRDCSGTLQDPIDLEARKNSK